MHSTPLTCPFSSPVICSKDASAVDNDAFFQGGLDFPFMGGHLFTAFQAGQMDLAAQANSAAGAVDGHIAAAQHQHPFS